MYTHSRRVRLADGESMGDVYDPYFNRTFEHFCSHQHTPPRPEASGFVCGARKGGVAYLAHQVFTQYAAHGGVIYRKYIAGVIRKMLGPEALAVRGLPSTGRLSLRWQEAGRRNVLHLLYAEKVLRGGHSPSPDIVCGYAAPTEVIEDLTPCGSVDVAFRTAEPVASVRLVPDGTALPFRQADGLVTFTVPPFECHAMVEIVRR